MKTVVVFFLLVAPVFAQQDAASPDHNLDRIVTLDVVATDKSGKPVAGLQQQDFRVSDDGRLQTLLSFRAVETASSAAPVTVILLIDAVNASFQAVGSAREEVAKFLRRDDGKLAQPVSVAFFTDAGAKTLNPPSRDGNAVAALLDKNEGSLRSITRAQGFYGATERLSLSLQTLGLLTDEEARVPGKKLFIWISPGWPMLSRPGVEISGRIKNDSSN